MADCKAAIEQLKTTSIDGYRKHRVKAAWYLVELHVIRLEHRIARLEMAQMGREAPMATQIVPKSKAMLELAIYTFAVAAFPVFGTSLAATNGNVGKSAIVAAAGSALAAGLAAVARAVKPLSTDAAGVGVAGVGGTPHDLSK